MTSPPRFKSLRFTRLIPIIALLALAALAGCGDDNKNPASPGGSQNPTSTSFTGVLLGGGTENGTLTVTVATTSLARSWSGAAVTATGRLTPTGASAVSLTGTYDADKDSLYLSGGGYTLAGEYDDNPSGDAFKSIAGGYTGPNGDGFFGVVLGATTQVHVFIGTFENQGQTLSGKWDMVAADSVAGCIAFPDGGTIDDVVAMVGSVEITGTTRAITLAGGTGTLTVTATGDWDTTTGAVAGTWTSEDTSIPETDDGTWTGELTAIPVNP